jgi:hypothetical protein
MGLAGGYGVSRMQQSKKQPRGSKNREDKYNLDHSSKNKKRGKSQSLGEPQVGAGEVELAQRDVLLNYSANFSP